MKTFALIMTITVMAVSGMALAGASERDGVRLLRAGGGGDRGGVAAARGGNLYAAADHESPQDRVDKREARQEKRIEQGIKHDQLTPDEVTKLKGLEDNIQSMEDQFKSDGKLTKGEAHKLGKALNEASLQIWVQRHDTEGKQKPVVRLGKDLFAPDELTSKIESSSFTKADARKFLTDFHHMVTLKRRLSSDNLTTDQHTKLQAEYNDLLNKYFSLKTP